MRIPGPSRIDRARALGYKAKKGIFVVRQRVPAGPHRRPRPTAGRRSKRLHTRLNLRKNSRLIAEERANRKFSNCEVVNSYLVGKDGKHYWYEVILAEPMDPSVMKDQRTAHLFRQRGRVFRGLTAAGKRMRGLLRR